MTQRHVTLGMFKGRAATVLRKQPAQPQRLAYLRAPSLVREMRNVSCANVTKCGLYGSTGGTARASASRTRTTVPAPGALSISIAPP